MSVFDLALNDLWYCFMEPSCSNKPGQISNLTEKCSLFNSLCSVQISCDPVIQPIQYPPAELSILYTSQFALLCPMFLTILCRQAFPTYFFIQHKCIAIMLGFQRLVVLTLNIPEQIS